MHSCSEVQSDLDQLGVVVRQLAVGQFVSLDDPGVFEDLPGRQPLVGVHVEHLGHQVLEGEESEQVSEKFHGDVGGAVAVQLHLGGVGHRVPVSPGQAKVAVPYPVEDLVRGVFRPVGEGCESVGETDGGVRRSSDRTVKTSIWMSESVFTRPAWCTAGLPDSRCRSPHRSPDASTPAIKKKTKKNQTLIFTFNNNIVNVLGGIVAKLQKEYGAESSYHITPVGGRPAGSGEILTFCTSRLFVLPLRE